MNCLHCGERLTSTHVAIKLEFVGGSILKNRAARAGALTYGVPGILQPARLCLECGQGAGQKLAEANEYEG